MKTNTDVIVLGSGQLGSAFARKTNFTVLNRSEFNYQNRPTNDDSMFFELNAKYQPKTIINCIGISDTRWCESKDGFPIAKAVNGYLPGYLSKLCKICGIKFVHISTGCLYDQSYPPQRETDFLVAHCQYTLTKWLGEIECDFTTDLILRPRLYFGPIPNKNNLLCKLSKFAKYTDVRDTITSVDVIVDGCQALLKNNVTGPVNIGCDGTTSMLEIAAEIGYKKDVIYSTDLRKQSGIYLVHAVMDLTKLKKYYQPPNWRDEVRRCWTLLNEENSI